ncbi:hypothetical protein [Aureispira sp. CCB-E]|uniref:hypothetical protein n=1 Tax=Aureispira sp. CCB-E TaxID=3051121 RepID=UPI002868E060|nr:hypothetical protein [Aureispira sp. CCB-E]WMX15153.1 hypothetical protein QP953_02060 [Aureispira sp. CCB-E]
MHTYHQRILYSLGLTLVLLAIGGWYFPSIPTSSMQSDWFWSNKVAPDRLYDVVFIGDSRIYRGINPELIEEALTVVDTLDVFNYGFSSAGLDTAFMNVGASLLDSNSNRRMIVLGVTASSLADENLANPHHWQEKKRHPIEIWQRKNINPYLSFFDPTSPEVIRNKALDKKSGYYQVYKSNGWIASDKLPRDEWIEYWHIQNTYPKVEFSTAVRENLIQKVAAWEAEGIEVFGFRPPAAAHFEAIEMQYYPEKAIKTQFEAVGGTWIDIPNRTSYVTYDGNHLEEQSARRLSTFIGEQMKAELIKEDQVLLRNSVLDFETPPPPYWSSYEPKLLQNKQVFKGATAYTVNAQTYSCTYTYPLDSFLDQNLYISTSCWMKVGQEQISQTATALLVFSIQNEQETILWRGERLLEQSLNPNKWNQLKVADAYPNTLAGCTLKVYVWNKGTTDVIIDQLKLEIFVDK